MLWFITGCSSGLGRCMTEHYLSKGDKVIATVRNASILDKLVQEYPKTLNVVELDVNQHDRIYECVSTVVKDIGIPDVVVNNAGYGLVGTVEEVEMDEIIQQMETNFFGLVAVTKAWLPHFRNRRSGLFVNLSSIAGWVGFANASFYCASKFAVLGFSEGLYYEMKPFDVNVSVLAPGPYKSEWAGRSLHQSKELHDLDSDSPYFELNKKSNENYAKMNGKQPGDPKQLAEIVYALSRSSEPPLHLILGDEAIEYYEKRLNKYSDPLFLRKVDHKISSL